MELESLNSTSQTSSSNQEQNASPSNLPSLKEARKVAIIIGVVIFLGIGYVARFTLTIDETISVGYNLLVRYVSILDYIITQGCHKTTKTAFLPGFFEIECTGSSGGTLAGQKFTMAALR